MNIVVDGTGLILMFSDNGSPSAGQGQTAYALTPDQAGILSALVAQPNSGVIFNGVTFTTRSFVPPVLPDFSNIDNLDKTFRAIGLMIANFTGKTPAQVKAAFLAAWNALP